MATAARAEGRGTSGARSDDPRFIVSRVSQILGKQFAPTLWKRSHRDGRERAGERLRVSPFPSGIRRSYASGMCFCRSTAFTLTLRSAEAPRTRPRPQRPPPGATPGRLRTSTDGPSHQCRRRAASAGVVLAHRPEKRVVRRERRHAFLASAGTLPRGRSLPERSPGCETPSSAPSSTSRSTGDECPADARPEAPVVCRSRRLFAAAVSAHALADLREGHRRPRPQHGDTPGFSRNTRSKRASCSAKPATSSRRTAKWLWIKFPRVVPCYRATVLMYDATTLHGADEIVIRSRSETSSGDLSLLSRAAAALTSDRHTQFPFKSQHSAQANVERPQTTWCRAARRAFQPGRRIPQKGHPTTP